MNGLIGTHHPVMYPAGSQFIACHCLVFFGIFSNLAGPSSTHCQLSSDSLLNQGYDLVVEIMESLALNLSLYQIMVLLV